MNCEQCDLKGLVDAFGFISQVTGALLIEQSRRTQEAWDHADEAYAEYAALAGKEVGEMSDSDKGCAITMWTFKKYPPCQAT